MNDSIASAAKEIVGTLVVLDFFPALSASAGQDLEIRLEPILERLLSSHTQALQGQVEELRKLLDEAFAVTEGHWHAHGGSNGCEVCDFHYHLIQEREARSILAAHRWEMK